LAVARLIAGGADVLESFQKGRQQPEVFETLEIARGDQGSTGVSHGNHRIETPPNGQ